jgi:5-oxoprolinase (ATP-hydrolysing) subunit A
MNTRINLNADLGESFGAWTMGDDTALLHIVGSANIACGFHAGDPSVMRRTVRQALAQGVSIGAHPAYPDLQGFGRRPMQLSSEELEAMLLYQIGALQALAHAEGGRVTHVKPHGALSNLACADATVAATVARAVHRLDPSLMLLAPAHSALAQAALAQGLPMRIEVFADRAYQNDGQLVPRSQAGAVLHTASACVEHVLRMLREQALVSQQGQRLPTPIDSICVHGDGPEAVATARAVRDALQAAGYTLTPLNQLPSR